VVAHRRSLISQSTGRHQSSSPHPHAMSPTRFLFSLVLAACVVCTLVRASVEVDLTIPDLRSAHPRIRSEGAIEWRLVEAPAEDAALMIMVTTEASSRLMTFDADATIDHILQTLVPVVHPSAVAPPKCHVVDTTSQLVLTGKTHLGAQLKKHAHSTGTNSLSLRCTGFGDVPFRHFVRSEINQTNGVRARNQLRRALTGEEAEYPIDAAELLWNNWTGVTLWVEAFLKHHWGSLYPYPDYTKSTTQTGRWHLNTGAVLQPGETFGPESDAPIRIAIAADWGSGTLESDYVQKVMMNGNGTAFDPEWTLHLGDIYPVGAPEFVQSNMLGQAPAGVKQGVTWPHGTIGSLAVAGNHEYVQHFGSTQMHRHAG
jgi:hypothetical protein